MKSIDVEISDRSRALAGAMPSGLPMTRRRLIKTLFCSSVAMELNLRAPSAIAASPPRRASSQDLLALGDFGSGNAQQKRVALAMADYAKGLTTDLRGLLLLGDNFYGPMPGGLQSSRWKSGFSEMYPAKNFPVPCWAVLGNHDYTDTPGNEKVQLGYAASLNRKTRWTMPGKYYRVDLPQITLLMIDTQWAPNSKPKPDKKPTWMAPDEMAAQQLWLESQLASPRAAFTIVVGHHPIYSDGAHGDRPQLIKKLAPVLEKHGVHLYLCGHDHDLQHLELEGLRTSFVISGGGGAGIRAGYEARKGAVIKATHGFTHLSIRENRLHVRHLESSGQLFHAFSKGVAHDWKIEG
jgi:hypothetical protein